MPPDVLDDFVARERRSDDAALLAAASGREYDYRRFCTSAWKVGNFLSQLGVRAGTTVAVAPELAPEPVLAFYGAATLGATVRFDPPADTDARAVVVPTAEMTDYDLPPGSTLVVYGSPPDSPAVSYFERDVWSQNPTQPPDRVTPEETLLATGTDAYTHRAVLAAARAAVESLSLSATDRVAVRAPLTAPGAVAAGLVAPILAGGEIVLPDGDGIWDAAVATDPDTAPEGRVLDPATLL
ncbi:MAG: hypothetical protein ABEJ06_05425 [Haloarculaceae archaeon]